MIPILDRRNQETGRYKSTLADEKLEEYNGELKVVIGLEDGDYEVPVWKFIERYLRIKTKSGQYSVFEINEAQCELYKEMCEQKRKGQPVRVDILKARQLGFSTFIGAVIFTLTILVPNQTACIIADTREHARNLFGKYQFYYANLPEFIKNKLPLITSNAYELAVDYGSGQSSKVRVLVQGENAGRSDTCQYLHLSEVAFWKDIEDTTTSILQTVDDTNPNSIIAYETTANGVNYYKEIWDTDVATGKDQGYLALFFPWYQDASYRIAYWGFELFDWEKELIKKFNLDLDQVAWYRNQYNKMRGNLSKLRQEMPSSPTEAFISTGANVFNMELLLTRKDEVMKERPLKQGLFQYKKRVSEDGSVITLENIRWVDSSVGEIKIYEEPQKGYPYVVNNDPAMGGEDYYATQVINNNSGCQCAVYHKNKCDADEVAFQMICLAKYYNNALLCGETNTTSYLLKLAMKCGYKFIYQENDYETLTTRYQDRLGYKTKTTNRQVMIELFAEAFRDNPKIIRDYETLCEMENFQVVRNDATGKEKMQAISGKHDDLVMAMCGFYLCRGSQRAYVDTEVSKYGMSIAEIEEVLERRLDEKRKIANTTMLKKGTIELWD